MGKANKAHYNPFKTERNKSLDKKFKKELLAESIDITCHWCKCFLDQFTATLEHITPLSEGGTYDRSNLTLACVACNEGRGKSISKIKNRQGELPTSFRTGNKLVDFISSTEELSRKVTKLYLDRKLKEGNLECQICKCFLDQHTACFTIKAKDSSLTRFNVKVFCYQCKNKNIGLLKIAYLPSKDNTGKDIVW